MPGFDGFCLTTYALARVPSYVTGLMMAVRQNSANNRHSFWSEHEFVYFVAML